MAAATNHHTVKPAIFRSQKVRTAARGERCTVEIVGVCNHDDATVVFCHFPDVSHGVGHKACDFSGGFACSSCHDAIDGRSRSDEFRNNKDWYLRRAQTRTLQRLWQLEILRLA